MREINCPFCGEGVLYETQREDEFGTIIPQIFCNCCKMIIEIENDSPYLNDDKTYEYLKEKLHKQFKTRKPIERILERLEEERKKEGYHMGNSCCGCGYDAFTDAIKIVKKEGGIE